MKLRKILTPVLTTIGACSVATPLVCLTSCAGDIEDKEFFVYNGEKEYELPSQYTIGSIEFSLNLLAGATAPDSVEPRVVIRSESSNINIVQCYGKWNGSRYDVCVDLWWKHEVTETSETTFDIQILSTVGEGKDAKTYQQYIKGFKFTLTANN